MLKKFEIALVDFPFSNLKETKKRPALVISPLEGGNTILCQITTKQRNIQKYEIILSRKNCKGNLLFDSFIYVDMIFTLHKNLIYRKIGEIESKSVKEAVKEKIGLIFS